MGNADTALRCLRFKLQTNSHTEVQFHTYKHKNVSKERKVLVNFDNG